MLMLKKPEVKEKELDFGDYVSIHVSLPRTSDVQNAESCAVLINREEFFQRIQKQRGALLPLTQKPKGDLIDVRLRTAVNEKMGWKNIFENETAEELSVA